MAEDLTTVQISKKASAMLEALADTYKRSKKRHAEWLIEQDYQKMADVKLVGGKWALRNGKAVPVAEAKASKSEESKTKKK